MLDVDDRQMHVAFCIFEYTSYKDEPFLIGLQHKLGLKDARHRDQDSLGLILKWSEIREKIRH